MQPFVLLLAIIVFGVLFLLFKFNKRQKRMDEVAKTTALFFYAARMTGMPLDEFVRRLLLLYQINPAHSEKLWSSAPKLAEDGSLGPTLVFTIWSKTGLAFRGKPNSMEQIAERTRRTFDLARRRWNAAWKEIEEKIAPKSRPEDYVQILQTLPVQ